jgi:hypothetical protein
VTKCHFFTDISTCHTNTTTPTPHQSPVYRLPSEIEPRSPAYPSYRLVTMPTELRWLERGTSTRDAGTPSKWGFCKQLCQTSRKTGDLSSYKRICGTVSEQKLEVRIVRNLFTVKLFYNIIFVGPQHGNCFMPPFERLEFWGVAPRFLVICAPLSDILLISYYISNQCLTIMSRLV